jgi:hemerythrin HHE cation binding domain-containing protein
MEAESFVGNGSFATNGISCSSPLPELEVPMINTLATCLGIEHRKLNGLDLQLAFAASRLARDPGNQQALQVWDAIRHDLWSHLQIEDGLVSWGEAHHAISSAVLDTVKNEREEMRKLIAAMRSSSPDRDGEPQTAGDPEAFAQTLLDLARALDSHVERYDGEVLPSIRRALFHK